MLLTVLSRIGQDSRVVLTHDVAQRDNLRVGRHDGVVAVVEKLRAPALRPCDPPPIRAFADCGPGHGPVGGRRPVAGPVHELV